MKAIARECAASIVETTEEGLVQVQDSILSQFNTNIDSVHAAIDERLDDVASATQPPLMLNNNQAEHDAVDLTVFPEFGRLRIDGSICLLLHVFLLI